MSLKLKISLGFTVICLMFIGVSVMLSVHLTEIGKETRLLRNVIIPALDQSSFLRYSLTLESLGLTQYAANRDEEGWLRAMEARSLNNQVWMKLKEHIGEIAELDPSVVGAEAGANKSYQEFQAVTAQLPDIFNSTNQAWLSTTSAHGRLTAAMAEYQTPMRERMADFISRGVAHDELAVAFSRAEEAAKMSQRASDIYLEMVTGLYMEDLSMLDEAMKKGTALRGEMVSLRDESRQQINKDRLQNLINAFDQCLQSLKTLRDNVEGDNLIGKQRAEKTATTREGIASLSTAIQDITKRFADKTIATVNNTRILLAGAAGACIIAAILISIFLVRSIVLPLNEIIGILTSESRNVERTSTELSSASQTVAEGTTENAASLEETSAAIEELSSMTKSNSLNTFEALKLTSQATDSMKLSEASMDKVIEAMSQIASSGNEIGRIIKTIDEIAFQTNLLALNAAVEAARAGEAGSGFAVVADEVRNLAIRSADAAKNTAELIARTINDISLGSDLVKKTSDNFIALVDSVDKVSNIIRDVSEASEQQSQGISQIAIAVSEMDKVTQTNAAVSMETANASQDLSKSANDMDQNVEKLVGIITGG